MQQKITITKTRWISAAVLITALFFSCLFLFSFTVSEKAGDDLWKQLGITQQQGTEKIRKSFIGNYFEIYGIRNLKNIATGNRAAVAKDLLNYTKQYINSSSFKNEYAKERMNAKPFAPTPNARSKEDIRKDKIADTQKLIKATEDILKTATGDLKKTMQQVLDMHNKNLKDYQDPGSKTIDMLYQQQVSVEQNDLQHYNSSLKIWEANYPADYRQLITARVQRYLDIASSVDFSAELTERNNKKYFANPVYEGKSNEWKMIFRAGKEVYDVTRPFAEQWLKELQ
ncbi:MAG: hypothetical protein JSU05_00405 [Bacteroidetes bacterium]|nr:hypothetical protein [Bacteroidota bacterium]